MKDLGVILDATVPVEVELLGQKITCLVYTAGWKRLTKEQRDAIQPVADKLNEDQERIKAIEKELENEVPEDRKPVLEAEADKLRNSAQTVMFARLLIPMMVGDMHIDGESVEYRGRQYPDFIPLLPDKFLLEVSNLTGEAIENPTKAEASQVTLEAEAQSEAQVADTIA